MLFLPHREPLPLSSSSSSNLLALSFISLLVATTCIHPSKGFSFGQRLVCHLNSHHGDTIAAFSFHSNKSKSIKSYYHPFQPHNLSSKPISIRYSSFSSSKTRTSLSMGGLFDFINSKFLNSREGDFVRLEDSGTDSFGPGPLILLYSIPESIDDDELRDMIEDGMPKRTNIVIRRVPGSDIGNKKKNDDDDDDEFLDLNVQEALKEVMEAATTTTTMTKNLYQPNIEEMGDSNTKKKWSSSPSISYSEQPCPVLYFSGVSNNEMMDTYRIIANEIYEETGGVHWAACAKVVPPAMDKSLRQVLLEISGDHADAMEMRKRGKTEER